MKGPSGRLRHRVRRSWHCPVCGRQRATSGAVVTLACDRCPVDAARPTWMRLIEEVRSSAASAGQHDRSLIQGGDGLIPVGREVEEVP